MKFRLIVFALALTFAPRLLAAPATTVQTATVKTERLARTVTAYGELVAAPGALDWLNAAHAGRIAAVTVTAGDAVSRHEKLVEVKPTPASQAALASARSALRTAEAKLKQTRVLRQGGLATQAELAAAAGSVASARARLAALQVGGSGSEVIRAPEAGVVTQVTVARGDWVNGGARLAAVVPVHALWVRLGLTPGEAAQVKPGAAVHVVPVFGAGRAVSSRVATVARQANAGTGLVDAGVPVKAGSDGPFVGEWVAGTITIATAALAAVPRSAVLQDKHGYYVFLVERGKARRRDVTPVIRARGLVGLKGLEAGATVVTLGNFELSDGAAVRLAGKDPRR